MIDDTIFLKRKILITCGTGGVGKTTLSAALGIRAMLLGRKTVVITIDPAKRLAHSLGLETLGNQPTDLSQQVQKAYREITQTDLSSSGTLAAIVPDTRRTFEDFVRELSPHPGVIDRLLKNPIFEIFANEFSGTNEYMALERLLTLSKDPRYDCIILDTPPSRNTLTFLKAPQLLSQFFEERVIRWLVLPTHKWLSIGMRKTLSLLEQLTGTGFMKDLFEFAASLFEVQVNFSASLNKITALLKSDQVGFLAVTTPNPDTLVEILAFIENLQEKEFQFDGVILNKTVSYLKNTPPVSSSYQEALSIIQALQEREKQVTDRLLKHSVSVCAKLPELARDVHCVEDLLHVALALGSTSFPSH